MVSPSHSVLVIGCGSIGERHLRCFQKNGRAAVAVCDTNAALVKEVAARYDVPGFTSLDEALKHFQATAWVICTPAQTHLSLALKGLGTGAHLLIEKPLAVDLQQVEAVRAAMAGTLSHVAVAYVYHSMPWVQGMREALASGVIGPAKHATLVAGQHFPTFRPAYREIYYTRHESGGGAIQDALTHMANMAEWILGPTQRLFCDAAHQVLEGVEVEDTVNIVARNGDTLVTYALNQFQAPNEMEFRIHGPLGSLAMQGHERRWGLQLAGETGWQWHVSPPADRDEWFVRQANSFLDGIEGTSSPLATFEEAVQTLKFNIAALGSARSGSQITLA